MARYYHVLSLLAVLSGVVSPPLAAEAAVQAQPPPPPPPPAVDTATFTSTCPTTQTRTVTHTLTQTMTIQRPVTQGGSFNEPGGPIDTTCTEEGTAGIATGTGTGTGIGGTATLTSHNPVVTDTTYRVISTETQTSSFTFFPTHNDTAAAGPTAGPGTSSCTEEGLVSSSSSVPVSGVLSGIPYPTTSATSGVDAQGTTSSSISISIASTSSSSEEASATITAPASTSDSPPTSYPTTSTTPLPVTAGSTALQAWSWYMKAPGGMGMLGLMLLAGLI